MSGCFFLRHCPFPRIVTSFSNVAGGKLVSYTTNQPYGFPATENDLPTLCFPPFGKRGEKCTGRIGFFDL